MPAPGSITLDATAIHGLSNHLMVILGFIELMMREWAGLARPQFGRLIPPKTR